MENNSGLKKYIPYLTAFVVFAAVSAFYFFPQYQGKTIVMGDIVQWEGMSKDIREHNELYGEDPQWTGNMFGGMPASLISMQYDSQLVKKFNPVLEFMGRPASLIFLAMASFFLMLLMFGVNPWVGIIAAVAYGLSTYFVIIIGAGHITKMQALAYAPLMVGGVWYTLRRNMWMGAVLTALAASLEISVNHPQITYYFGFIILALWINEGIKAFRNKLLPRFAKATGLLAVAAILALGSNLAPLWYINEYSKDSIRGGSELAGIDNTFDLDNPDASKPKNSGGLDLEYMTQWSYGKAESFNMFIPNLYGGSSEGNFSDYGPVASSLVKYGARNQAASLPSYWGDQPVTAGPTYIGAVVIFLFVLSLFLLCPATTVWVVVVSLIALLLAWGHNFMWFTKLFYYVLPGYNKFRTVSMILVIVQWTMPFLAALVLNKLWKGNLDTARIKRAALNSLYITGGVALLFALLGGMLFSFISPTDAYFPGDVAEAMRAERVSMMRLDSWRSLIFVALAAGTVLLFAGGKIKRGVLAAVTGLLVCVDLAGVDLRYMPQSKFVDENRATVRPTAADRQIMQDDEPGFRVLNLTVSPFNDAVTSNFHRSVGGYHGAKMARYQDLITWYLNNPKSQVYNMLNTKYIIDADEKTGELIVVPNRMSNGAAWLVEDIILADGAEQEISTLGYIDNKREAVVDVRFEGLLPADIPSVDSTAYISLTDYKANHLTYQYSSPTQSLAVFSEIYYDKGWTAYIDGAEAPHFRANYVLRAMVLPPGEHTVEFRFRAENFGAISTITLIFSLLVLAGAVAAVAAHLMCRKKKSDNDTRQQEA